MICQNCFEENKKSAEICVSCGMRLTDDFIFPDTFPDVIEGKKIEYASFWGRFVASIIDGFIVGMPVAIIGMIAVFVVAGSGANEGTISMVQLLFQLISGLVGWLYFAFMESSSKQATFGKQALGFIVTDEAGQRLTFSRATGRHFGKFISALILYIGYIMAGFTDKKQALHDKMANAVVVRKSGY